jgi:hypothetical protein
MKGGRNMSKWIKILTPTFLLAVVLATLLFTGCGEKEAGQETPEGMNPPGILADSILAMKSVNSYTYNMDMKMAMEATGGSSPGNIKISMQGNGAADVAAKKMKMSSQMHLDEINVPEQSEDMPQDFSTEMYMIEDMLYIKMDMPDTGEQWLKMPVSEEMKDVYALDTVKSQMAPLEKAVDIKFVKYETVDGAECYVLNVVPDMASMKDWFQSQQMTTGAFDFSELDNMQDIFKDLAYTVWISKDGNLIKKMDINMTTELKPAQVGVAESEFDKMTMKIDMEMTITHYNESVSIILPEEAENAIGTPSMQ